MNQQPPLVPTKSSGCLPWVILLGFLLASLFMAINVYLSWKGSATSTIMSPATLISNIKSAVPTLSFLRTFTASPSAAPEPTVYIQSPSKAPVVINKSLNIQIQNSSGLTGIANKAKIALQAAGYANITIGNTQKDEYDQTVIMQKTGFEDDALNIRKILFGISSLDPANNIINPLSTHDIIIIIGKNSP